MPGAASLTYTKPRGSGSLIQRLAADAGGIGEVDVPAAPDVPLDSRGLHAANKETANAAMDRMANERMGTPQG
jgi:hypothetical protein